MDRSKILSRALTRPPHPRYGVLTAFKYNLLHELENPRILYGDIKPGTIEQIWAVAVLDTEDPAVKAAPDDGGAALKEVWLEHYHPSEMMDIIAWLDAELLGVDAAATEEKPERGKEEAQGE